MGFSTNTFLMIAYVLALPIGLDRQVSSRHFGLRTFPLVAGVSCGFMLTGISVIDSTDGEARVIQGIITGI
jgi:putative Mg2+ transporter-C (MgtC) family protein